MIHYFYVEKIRTLPLFDPGFSTLHCFLYFKLVNYVVADNKRVEQHNMSFISTNTISHKDFIDDKDDYKIEDFEFLSAPSYFFKKSDLNPQNQLLAGLLGDWVDPDNANSSNNNINASRLPVKPVHHNIDNIGEDFEFPSAVSNNIDASHLPVKLVHYKTDNIGSPKTTGFYYASLLPYFFFDTQSETTYYAIGSSSPLCKCQPKVRLTGIKLPPMKQIQPRSLKTKS